MEIFFNDPDDIPLPPEEVRIRELVARPYPDGRRVRVYFELTPFQRQPDAELHIRDQDGRSVASVSVIETIDPKMEMTLHLRGPSIGGKLKLEATVFYRLSASDEGQIETIGFSPPETEIMVVDQAEATIDLD